MGFPRSTTQTDRGSTVAASAPNTRYRLRVFLLAVMACSLALPVSAQDTVSLQPPLKVSKGQAMVTVQQSRTSTKVVDTKTKQTMKDLSQSRTLDLHQAVLETNAAGGPIKLRLTVTAVLDLKATLPVEEAFEQRVELRNVQVDLSFTDDAWRMDTESIRSREMKVLTGAELHLLRRVVRDALQVHARPDLLLFPARATTTAKIQPTFEQLSRWSAAANESGRTTGQATDAEFRLDKQLGGVLDLTGRVHLLVPVEKESVKATMDLSLQLDAATGLMRRRGVEFALLAPAGSGATYTTGSGVEVTSVVAVRDPSSAPAGPVHALGWKTEKDTTTWRDARLGVGLALPRGVSQRPGQLTWDVPGGGGVSLDIRQRDFFPTLAQVVEASVTNLRRAELELKDVQPGEPFRLPDGLPAALVHAHSQDGKTAMLILLTADGHRTFAVTAAGPAGDNALLGQLEQILRNLRLSDPSPPPRNPAQANAPTK